jgi:MerR family mercuric resistance operon transcriptional regulator
LLKRGVAVAQSTEIQIGELSRQTGYNVETIRYYERVGLLPHPLAAPRGIGFTRPGTFGA